MNRFAIWRLNLSSSRGYAARSISIRPSLGPRPQVPILNPKGCRGSHTPALNARILGALENHVSSGGDDECPTGSSFGKRLLLEYETMASRTLSMSLPTEPTPNIPRRPAFDRVHDALVMVAHVTTDRWQEYKITVSSGFAVDVPSLDAPVIISCAHTLEEMRHNRIFKSPFSISGTFIVTPSMDIFPVSSILSSLPLSDLVMYALYPSTAPFKASFPVSPYPAPLGTPVRYPLISFDQFLSRPHAQQDTDVQEGWLSWKDGVVSSRWTRGKVLGYRDRAGREAHPGTYDQLSYIRFSPIPSPGSSGAPVIDEESGSVVAVVTGHGTINRIEGHNGFGTPAEAIFEMFSLPGFSKPR